MKISLPRAAGGTLKYYDSADETWYDVEANDVIAVGDFDVFTVESVDTLLFSYADNPSNPGGGTSNPGGDTPNPGGDTPNPGGETPNPGGETPNPGGETPNPGTSGTSGTGGTAGTDSGSPSPKTGDSSAPLAVAASALAAAAAIVVLKKKLAV